MSRVRKKVTLSKRSLVLAFGRLRRGDVLAEIVLDLFCMKKGWQGISTISSRSVRLKSS